ncbi:MAG: addiction module antidote protein, HigA family [Desulfobulbaceae bacterium C00003063]|nr:MAG: addiction module antidote protein, HigA family [Desulfobulbaceae bacterium C00003063]
MSAMHNPPHPGAIIKEDVLGFKNLSVTEAARQLGISRVTLSRLLNGKTGVSVDMALRLSQWLGTTPELWLRMQDACDLWQAGKTKRPKVKPLQSREAAVILKD